MNCLLQEYADRRFVEIIEQSKSSNSSHNIFVLMGLLDILDMSKYQEYLVDSDTFNLDGDDSVFNEDWFSKVFTSLRSEKPLHILSYPQYYYFTSYAPNLQRFNNRVSIVYDNVRALFPIKTEAYIEKANEEGLEERPETLPLYQAEQVCIDGRTYCSYVTPSQGELIGLFSLPDAIATSANGYDELLEINDNMYSLDVFLNNAFLDSRDKRVLGVKRINDTIRADEFNKRLEYANGLLKTIGAGEIVYTGEQGIIEDYIPNEGTIQLLKQYWGQDAQFRKIIVYKNPGEGNSLISISQGQVVDLIINEYKKGRDTESRPDDIFITAPTGSGKSLLFQLPGFYVSSCHDVTIVISPLIALMKDQVLAIKNDRKFDKVAYLNSELNLIEREQIIEKCINGHIDMLYMSPELLLSYDVSHFIGDRRIGLMVIDEAHLITTWGRDFRVDYWHLGNHINRIRKYKGLRFPLVALTATAIYGGPNDMVVDSMGSLFMHNPHLFLGKVKRNNIRFVINNYQEFHSNYKLRKLQQTVSFINAVNSYRLKTVVYAPYTTHVQDIVFEANRAQEIAVPYYGELPQDLKETSYFNFMNNRKLIMVCTKAFGMGVDIKDIQVIYHHAPSGLLPDYIQEVGRAARDDRMTGFAALDYNEKDTQFSKQLFGMSALRQGQLREVLRKIYSMYELGGKKRNMLVSVDDFDYIFDEGEKRDERGAKIKTALMMLEKDYLTRVRYNALIARPKQLFVKCYARTNNLGLSVLEQHYNGYYRILRKLGEDSTAIELDLDEIWKKDFSSLSFGVLKRKFYKGDLLDKYNVKLISLTRITISINRDYTLVREQLFTLLNTLSNVFGQLSSTYFSEKEFSDLLANNYNEQSFRDKITRYVLSTFSGQLNEGNVLDSTAFLQRREDKTVKYTVFNQEYIHAIDNIKRVFERMFENNNSKFADRYSSKDDGMLLPYTRLGGILELLELATYEIKGGDDPKIFIRINDPSRIRRDSENLYYKNNLLERTLKKHAISHALFDHFFTNTFSSDERWDFIEDFFLGATNEELFEKYPENAERNHVDIVKYIVDNIEQIEHKEKDGAEFPPKADEFYLPERLITIEGRTMTMADWINRDPVCFDKVRRKLNLGIGKQAQEFLLQQIRRYHHEYYVECMGLSIPIEFKGYSGLVPASIPYSANPVDFYKWWKKAENTNKVALSKKELLQLINKVYQKEPRALIAKHKKMIIK